MRLGCFTLWYVFLLSSHFHKVFFLFFLSAEWTVSNSIVCVFLHTGDTPRGVSSVTQRMRKEKKRRARDFLRRELEVLRWLRWGRQGLWSMGVQRLFLHCRCFAWINVQWCDWELKREIQTVTISLVFIRFIFIENKNRYKSPCSTLVWCCALDAFCRIRCLTLPRFRQNCTPTKRKYTSISASRRCKVVQNFLARSRSHIDALWLKNQSSQ